MSSTVTRLPLSCAIRGRVRQKDGVVLILAARAGASGLEDADRGEDQRADAKRLANRVFVAEEHRRRTVRPSTATWARVCTSASENDAPSTTGQRLDDRCSRAPRRDTSCSSSDCRGRAGSARRHWASSARFPESRRPSRRCRPRSDVGHGPRSGSRAADVGAAVFDPDEVVAKVQPSADGSTRRCPRRARRCKSPPRCRP